MKKTVTLVLALFVGAILHAQVDPTTQQQQQQQQQQQELLNRQQQEQQQFMEQQQKQQMQLQEQQMKEQQQLMEQQQKELEKANKELQKEQAKAAKEQAKEEERLQKQAELQAKQEREAQKAARREALGRGSHFTLAPAVGISTTLPRQLQSTYFSNNYDLGLSAIYHYTLTKHLNVAGGLGYQLTTHCYTNDVNLNTYSHGLEFYTAPTGGLNFQSHLSMQSITIPLRFEYFTKHNHTIYLGVTPQINILNQLICRQLQSDGEYLNIYDDTHLSMVNTFGLQLSLGYVNPHGFGIAAFYTAVPSYTYESIHQVGIRASFNLLRIGRLRDKKD